MGYKQYQNVFVQENWNTFVWNKHGEVGKSHKTPRPYSNVWYGGASTGQTRYDRDELATLIHRHPPQYYYERLFSSNDKATFHNRLVSKLRGKCGPSADLGTAIFSEGKEAVGMAVKNLTEMAKLARAIKRGDVIRLAKMWKGKRRKVREACAEAGGRWLEFSWGWSPLVSSIHDAMAATAGQPKDSLITVIHSTPRLSSRSWTIGRRYHTEQSYCEFRQKVGVVAHVSNPNIWLANELGFLNPVTWVWEAIPFSWLADYFVNVGALIQNMDRFAGLSISGKYTTTSIKSIGHILCVYTDANGGKHPYMGDADGLSIIRTLDMPDLNMQLSYNFENPLTSSWRRGLNASAFLSTRLRR